MITEYYEEKCLLNCGKKKKKYIYVYGIVGINMFTV